MVVEGIPWTPARLGRVRLGASSGVGWRSAGRAPVKGNSRDSVCRSPALADARLAEQDESTTLRNSSNLHNFEKTLYMALTPPQNHNWHGLGRILLLSRFERYGCAS